MKNIFWCGLLMMLLCSLSNVYALELQDSPKSGEYATEGGWGTLNIENKGDVTVFALYGVDSASNYCDLKGDIKNGHSSSNLHGDFMESGNQCVVSFNLIGTNIMVKHNHALDCAGFCGGHLDFEDLYKPVSGCTRNYINDSLAEYDGFNNRGKDNEALNKLEPLLKNCGQFLSEYKLTLIRSNLANTYFALGRYSECKEVLQPINWLGDVSEAELRDTRKADYDEWIRMAESVKENICACDSTRKGCTHDDSDFRVRIIRFD